MNEFARWPCEKRAETVKVSSHRGIWRAYRAEYMSERSEMYPILRALKYALKASELRRVRHATFEGLSAAGYDVRTVDDGSKPFAPPPGDMPEHWRRPQPTIIPKVATLRDAELFKDGSVLLPDGNYCFFDTTFLHLMEESVGFGSVGKFVIPSHHRLQLGPFSIGTLREEKFSSNSELKHSNDSEFVYIRPSHLNRRILRNLDPRTGEALIQRPRKHVKVPGRCFSTRSSYPENVSHLIFDMLSRIYYEDLGVIAPGREKIIAPRFYFPMQRILFERIFADYEIVNAPPKAILKVEELLLPGNLRSMGRFNALAVSALAKRMRRLTEPFAAKENLKVCVSRGDGQRGAGTPGRDFVNEEAYEALMRNLGYHIVNVSKLDPDTQLSLWGNTTDMVGVNGAGMTNMILMPTGGNYTEITGAPVDLMPESCCPRRTAISAMIAGHRVSALEGKLDNDGLPMIDLARLEGIIG